MSLVEVSGTGGYGAAGLALAVHVTIDGLPLNNREEFIGLVSATGAEIATVVNANVRSPDPKLFLGAGKVEEIRESVSQHQPDLVIVNLDLSPSQERNLEKRLHCRVIDRTRLILDIFAQRATSHEGKLQVELAQLSYLSTRLVRGWTHLERQRGGIGLRGPGETQLESDRRMLGVRVAQLKKALKKVNKRRQLGRSSRRSRIVALAGYTNAGKTSLFNRLCADDQFVANQLFASLDTILRRIALPGARQAVLVDTVGFVENLPHQLVEAFASTLEEVVQADLILHVCDAADPRRVEKIDAVEQVLEEIGALGIPRLLVWNKCELLEAGEEEQTLGLVGSGRVQTLDSVAISVHTGKGLDRLRKKIATVFAPARVSGWFRLSDARASKNRAYLHKIDAIRAETSDAEGHLFLYLEADAAIVQKLEGVDPLEQGAKAIISPPALDDARAYP